MNPWPWTVRRRESRSRQLSGSKTGSQCEPHPRTQSRTVSCCRPGPCSSWGWCTGKRSRTVGCTGASRATRPVLLPAATPPFKSLVSAAKLIVVVTWMGDRPRECLVRKNILDFAPIFFSGLCLYRRPVLCQEETDVIWTDFGQQ